MPIEIRSGLNTPPVVTYISFSLAIDLTCSSSFFHSPPLNSLSWGDILDIRKDSDADVESIFISAKGARWPLSYLYFL